MDPTAALYFLTVCVGEPPYCHQPLGPRASLTRQECVEHMQLIRWQRPDKRVICRTPEQTDVVDSAGKLSPRYIMIAPSEPPKR